MAPSLGKMPTTSARRLTYFSIPVSSVNCYIAPPASIGSSLRCSGQVSLLMVSPGGSLLYELVRGRRLRMGYGQELRGASLFAASCSRKERCGRQRSKTHSPQHRPRRDLFGRVERAADLVWTARLRLSADSPRPSSTSCAAPRPACAPGRLWPCPGRGAWPAVRPTTSGRTSHGCDG
jgi:hypothetical protein